MRSSGTSDAQELAHGVAQQLLGRIQIEIRSPSHRGSPSPAPAMMSRITSFVPPPKRKIGEIR